MKTAMTVSYLLVLILLAGSAYSDDLFNDNSLDFKAKLTGDQEVPPVVSKVRAKAQFEVNKDRTKMDYELKAKSSKDEPVGLLGAQVGAHIHCAPAGENGPIVVPLAGVIEGGVDGKVTIKATVTDANITNPSCGTNIKELVDSMLAGKTYVNIHSKVHPGGEVRGQIELDD